MTDIDNEFFKNINDKIFANNIRSIKAANKEYQTSINQFK